MPTNNRSQLSNNSQSGFTLLELAVVVIVVSVVGLVALHYYFKLLVDIERTTMERDLGVLRSAVGLEVAAHYVAGNMAGLERLAGRNPMDLLVELPDNYRGEIDNIHRELKTGSWYYDKETGYLVYLVRNRLYFESERDNPLRAEFSLEPVFSQRRHGETVQLYISGLTLKGTHSYRWVPPWK